MIHDAIIFTALAPLVGGTRCYPVMIPQEEGTPPVWPAIRYTPVGGTITPDACGGGTAVTDDQRVQIDCIAKTYKAAGALCELARAAMEALAVPTVADGPPLYEYDAETQTFRAIQDFTIYGSSPA